MLRKLEKIVKKEFGVTDDLIEAGYVLSDGTLVDFSGRRDASGYVRKGDRFVPKRGYETVVGRNLDHRQLPMEISDALGVESGTPTMHAFMADSGSLRVSSGNGFSVLRLPSVESVSSFLKAWKRAYGNDRPVVIDVVSPGGHNIAFRELAPDLEEIMEFIESSLSRGHAMGNIWKKGPTDWSPSGKIPGMPIWPKFVDAYLEAALWSSIGPDGEPLDRSFGVEDMTPETINKAIEDSNKFITENRELLERHGNESQHGHDFWLTRNGHGAGFWDRGYGDDGDTLTAAAEADEFGEEYIVVDDDSKLRFL